MSFNLWKAAIILFCIGAFVLSLFGGNWLSAAKSEVEAWVSDLTSDDTTWSFRYNEKEGTRFSVLKKVEIHGKELALETVDDAEGIQQGLSDRPSMSDDEGLLFVMPNVDIHTFWMYHMNFAIDMVWLRNGEVVEIAENMLEPSQTGGIPMTHTPRVLSDMVLELTAGGVERYGLEVGDKLDF
jgi:hypothetical protein